MDRGPTDLTLLLLSAADGKPGAAEEFFKALLNSHVFIPVRRKGKPAVTLVGEKDLKQLGYVTVSYEGRETLPIFSEEEFVLQWSSESDVQAEEQEFKKLLWLVGDDKSLYLNPSQDVGKELTPWEIEQLRKGERSIPELVAELNDEVPDEYTIDASGEVFPELKAKLRPILEIYPELVEAFLISMSRADSGEAKPALGLKFEKISDAKRLYLRSEFENLAAEMGFAGDMLIVEDLENPQSANWRLFEEAMPFFLTQRGIKKRGPFGRAAHAIKSFFRRFRGQ